MKRCRGGFGSAFGVMRVERRVKWETGSHIPTVMKPSDRFFHSHPPFTIQFTPYIHTSIHTLYSHFHSHHPFTHTIHTSIHALHSHLHSHPPFTLPFTLSIHTLHAHPTFIHRWESRDEASDRSILTSFHTLHPAPLSWARGARGSIRPLTPLRPHPPVPHPSIPHPLHTRCIHTHPFHQTPRLRPLFAADTPPALARGAREIDRPPRV